MRSPIAVALGLMLLMSAAAATGNGNTATIDVTASLAANYLSDACFDQLSDLDANLLGSDIEAIQTVNLMGVDNCLTGLGPDKTFLMQSGIEMLNDSGCGNSDMQIENLMAVQNSVATGDIIQVIQESSDVQGNGNYVIQNALNAPFSNSLVDSELMQASGLCAVTDGNGNGVLQSSAQIATDNCLTESNFIEEISLSSDIIGCNNIMPEAYNSQLTMETAAFNSMVNAHAIQSVSLDTQSVGDHDLIVLYGTTDLINDCIDDGMVLQNIDANAISMGCNNIITHIVGETNSDSSIIGGNIVQDVSITTDQ